MFAFTQLLNRLNAKENVSLASLSTMRVGAKAKYLVIISSLEELCLLQKALYEYSGCLLTISVEKIYRIAQIRLGVCTIRFTQMDTR